MGSSAGANHTGYGPIHPRAMMEPGTQQQEEQQGLAEQSEAIRHVTANLYEAVVADQDALIKAIGEGMKVETAQPEPEAA